MITSGTKDVSISDQAKIRIITDFILFTPPGELEEVLNDVRILVNNDDLLKEFIGGVCARYIRDQMMPVKISNSDYSVLITVHNDIGNSRYYDPRSKQSFKVDHIKSKVSDYHVWSPVEDLEYYRRYLEVDLDMYVEGHYPHGVCSVYASGENQTDFVLTACIESHNFQPDNFSNGCWRSQWRLIISRKSALITGEIKVRVHYYDNGNVQLASSKEVRETFVFSSREQITKEFLNFIIKSENNYQKALVWNYNTMSNTTFKALRRVLPVTRAKIDWNKIISYSVGKELKKDNGLTS